MKRTIARALPYVSRISERAAHVCTTEESKRKRKREGKRETERVRETTERTLLDSEHSRSY